jgi:hypothetical protein
LVAEARSLRRQRNCGPRSFEPLASATERDIQAIARRLVDEAKDGDIHAARIVLEYTLGKPVEHDILERIEALECEREAGGVA